MVTGRSHGVEIYNEGMMGGECCCACVCVRDSARMCIHACKGKMSTRVCGRYLDLAQQYDALSLAICFAALWCPADTQTKMKIFLLLQCSRLHRYRERGIHHDNDIATQSVCETDNDHPTVANATITT